MYKRFWKRVLDLLLSGIGIIVLIPIGVILSLAIMIDDPGPVLFRQKRVAGKRNGAICYFSMLKFRTMKTSTPRDIPTHMLDNPEQYITRIGRILRMTSLDELPQILNIFIGQMSVVGPRPALWNQYDLIRLREQYGVNDFMPGLSGWAQVNGRDELEIPIKVQYDVEYCRNMSFGFDCMCFWKTVVKVLKCEGIVEGTGGYHDGGCFDKTESCPQKEDSAKKNSQD